MKLKRNERVYSNGNYGVIPKPYLVDESVYGEFILSDKSTVFADEGMGDVKDFFVELIKETSGFTIPTVLEKPTATIQFLFDNHIPTEGYTIDCSSEILKVFASTYAGGLYAIQTLRQLLQTDEYDSVGMHSMHATHIEDRPKYKWRALMLDESRWFFGKETVKRMLRLMSRFKLNTLHWHLSDNEGWRVEIKKYPLLTEIGSKRRGTQNMSWGRYRDIDWTAHEGFYTQDDIREIVEYAAKLNIDIVPEIDMPAHFNSAIAGYPFLSCKGKKIEVPVSHSGPGSTSGIIACAGKESTYQFIYDVIDELSELFPSKYFHIGGDEAPKNEWMHCKDCQNKIKENGLADEEELQAYFNNRVALYLKSKGKRIIGWNEILKGKNLDKNTIVQYWVAGRDVNVENYAKGGGTIIMSKHQSFYFDMPYALCNLKATYEFTPEAYGISSKLGAVAGVEGTLWTEWMFSQDRLDFQLFPRMQALSETAWSTTEGRNYEDFKERLKTVLKTLDKLGVSYAPEALWDRKGIGASFICSRFFTGNAHCEYNKALKIKGKK